MVAISVKGVRGGVSGKGEYVHTPSKFHACVWGEGVIVEPVVPIRIGHED
jgi:hypothetical protein